MRDFAILLIHLIVTVSKLMRPGGGRAVVAESLRLKHQLVVLNRGRDRAPNLRPMDRVVAGLCTLFIRPGRVHTGLPGSRAYSGPFRSLILF